MDRLISPGTSYFGNGITPSSISDDNNSDIYTRYQSQIDGFIRSDQARNDLMHRLFQDNATLHKQVAELSNDIDSERQSRRLLQDEVKKIRVENDRTVARSDSNPFCLVLIDGDGCMFHEKLLKAADRGGADAAHSLNEEVKQLLREKGISTGCSVMVQVYMNLHALAYKLRKVGILDIEGHLNEFAQAFGIAQSLFSIVDVGRGKERADHKIREMFKIFVNNSHCKHIVFGGCHDNGYIPTLMPYSKDLSVMSRLTLLETTPAQPGFYDLSLDMTRFESVFRDTPLPEWKQASPPPAFAQPQKPMSPAAHAYVPHNGNVFSPSPAPSERKLTPPSTITSPVGTGRPLSKVDSNGPPAAAKTWATIGGNADAKNIDVKPAAKPAKKYILYNLDGYRIDEALPKPPPTDAAKFQARYKATGKFCNEYHLRGVCRNRAAGLECPEYTHEPPLNEGEKVALRHRVRTTPCNSVRDNTSCEDFNCFYGHNCPFGDTTCTRPGDCKFASTHGMDKKVDSRLWEDGSFDPLRV